MYQIAILGCENSHADTFVKQIQNDGCYDIEIIGVYSDEPETLKKFCDKYGLTAMKSYEELAGKVDGIMITARHGDNHYKYAKPYIPYKIPMFIDKPITCKEAEALEFMRELRKNQVQVCGGSMCIYAKEAIELAEVVKTDGLGGIQGGNLFCPIMMDSPYGGFYFYAQHLIETMLSIFGYDIKAVNAVKREGRMSLIARYDQYEVTATYSGNFKYQITLLGKDEIKSSFLTLGGNDEMNDMYALLKGQTMKMDYDTFIKPVFVMNALLRSCESGRWENISEEKV